jgi:hypothetical protein
MKTLVLFVIFACLSAGIQACDGDGTNQDADACCDNDVQPDGNDDVDSDADGETPVEYGNLIVTSVPVQGADIELDRTPSDRVTNYTFENLVTGAHSVLLSLAGRLQVSDTGELNQPTEVNVTRDGTNVNIVLYWDVTGNWHNADTSAPVTLEMWNRNRITGWLPTDVCPDTVVVIHGLEATGAVCVEEDGSLSLCKNDASGCDGYRAEGNISPDGQRLEFTLYPPSDPSEHYVYVKD